MNSFQRSISAAFLSAGIIGGADGPAAANTSASAGLSPVQTSASLTDFYSGASSTITCNAGGETLRIMPLEDDADNAFIGLGNDDEQVALKDRQAAVNACMNLGLK